MSTQLRTFQSRLETIYSADLLNTALRDCKDEPTYDGDNYVCFVHDASNNDIYKGDNSKLASYYNDDNSARILDISSSFMPIHYNNLSSYDPVNNKYTYTFGNVYAHLIGNADQVGTYLDFQKDLSDVYHAIYSNSHFDNHTEKMNEYMNMKKTRKDLDRKMREIYDEKNSDTYMMFDNSVYTNLAWTVLATSVLYYLFVKL
jgi:hypothetical protein